MADLLLTASRLITDPGAPVIADGAVLVRGERIAAVGPAAEIRENAETGDVERVDVPGGTILPGLVNAHVHLCFDVTRDPVPVLERGDPGELRAVVAANAAALLDEGVTTARDLGDRDGVVDAHRRAAVAGTAAATRLLTAFAPLTTPGGHCWFLGGEVADGPGRPGAIRDAVAARAARGADWIKVMAGGGMMTPSGVAMWESQFSPADLDLVVAAAHEAGLPVAAHAHGTATIERCARAGVDTVEHGSWIVGRDAAGAPILAERDDVADRLAAAGIAVVPTRARRWWTWPPEAGLDVQLAKLRWMRERGVRIVVGTDAGVGQGFFDDVVETLTLYEAAGWSRAQVLAMATVDAARTVGVGERTGRLAVGRDADVLVVDGDPLADLTALRALRLVVAAGRPHRPAR